MVYSTGEPIILFNKFKFMSRNKNIAPFLDDFCRSQTFRAFIDKSTSVVNGDFETTTPFFAISRQLKYKDFKFHYITQESNALFNRYEPSVVFCVKQPELDEEEKKKYGIDKTHYSYIKFPDLNDSDFNIPDRVIEYPLNPNVKQENSVVGSVAFAIEDYEGNYEKMHAPLIRGMKLIVYSRDGDYAYGKSPDMTGYFPLSHIKFTQTSVLEHIPNITKIEPKIQENLKDSGTNSLVSSSENVKDKKESPKKEEEIPKLVEGRKSETEIQKEETTSEKQQVKVVPENELGESFLKEESDVVEVKELVLDLKEDFFEKENLFEEKFTRTSILRKSASEVEVTAIYKNTSFSTEGKLNLIPVSVSRKSYEPNISDFNQNNQTNKNKSGDIKSPPPVPEKPKSLKLSQKKKSYPKIKIQPNLDLDGDNNPTSSMEEDDTTESFEDSGFYSLNQSNKRDSVMDILNNAYYSQNTTNTPKDLSSEEFLGDSKDFNSNNSNNLPSVRPRAVVDLRSSEVITPRSSDSSEYMMDRSSTMFSTDEELDLSDYELVQFFFDIIDDVLNNKINPHSKSSSRRLSQAKSYFVFLKARLVFSEILRGLLISVKK